MFTVTIYRDTDAKQANYNGNTSGPFRFREQAEQAATNALRQQGVTRAIVKELTRAIVKEEEDPALPAYTFDLHRGGSDFFRIAGRGSEEAAAAHDALMHARYQLTEGPPAKWPTVTVSSIVTLARRDGILGGKGGWEAIADCELSDGTSRRLTIWMTRGERA